MYTIVDIEPNVRDRGHAMIISNTRELGLLLRQRREDLGLTQSQAASGIGASRQWIIQIEAGKPTAEVNRVLKLIRVLGLRLDVREVGEMDRA